MCGITGASWTARGEPLSRDVLERMQSVLVHRGPDDDGAYFSKTSNGQPGAALGFRRLSIIDLESGHQPLANEDETVWIVFNGEIYNYRELRPDLEARGHRFRTHSDTETIVHLYEEYGVDCLKHLRGMFAFAIWDDRKKILFLARDRLGKKPLVYRQESERLAFASELKSLLQIPGAGRTLDPVALDRYLMYQYVPYPDCILQGYQKLPPAHYAVYDNGKMTVERYWTPPYDSSAHSTLEVKIPDANASEHEWRKALRETVTEAVRLRMRSDVPLGAFLSGGIDSTIIAGLMQQLSAEPIHTFTIGFPVAQFDERSYAREAAEHLGTIHHETIVEPKALDILPKLIWHYDEPFADSSAIPMMYLAQTTREHVTVALSGDGGDELFAGYERYRAIQLSQYFDVLPQALRSLLFKQIWKMIPASVQQKSSRRRLKRFVQGLGDASIHRYGRWISVFDEDQRETLLSSDFKASIRNADPFDFLENAYDMCRKTDFVTQTTCADVHTYLPGDILTKVDIASMAYSLECRCPLLDQQVAELAARIPLSLKMRGSQQKKILIDTFAEFIPPRLRKRRKMGFGVPLDHWFRNELKEMLRDTLLSTKALQRGYFNPQAVEKLVEDHLASRVDHSNRLWLLLCFELWQQMFLDEVRVTSRDRKGAGD
ncbi:MAG: asparagine synthase (glutamine-hydrolyzing) [Planctomycetota bacterium]|nr:asparagine synthase (glutamine-hydrolyzing) [Planctomycetota bacterium]